MLLTKPGQCGPIVIIGTLFSFSAKISVLPICFLTNLMVISIQIFLIIVLGYISVIFLYLFSFKLHSLISIW